MGGYYQVPVGYKFRPSEEELLLHYLQPRLNGDDYPKGVVPDCDLYGTKETWEIRREIQAQHVHDDHQHHIGASTYDQLRAFEDYLKNQVEDEQDTMVNSTVLAQYGQQGTSTEDQLRFLDDYLMNDIEG